MINTRREDQIFYIRFGLIFFLHALIFLASYYTDLSSLFGNKMDSETLKILKSSVRVDVVGMPKHTFQELKELEKSFAEQGVDEVDEAEKEKPVAINEDDITIEKASKVDLKQLLGQYGDKKVKAKDVKKEKGKIKIKDMKSLILEGNKISSGSSIVGDNSSEIATEFESYVQNLPDLVRKFWKLPSYLKDQNLNCRIKVFIDAQGRVVRKVIVTSSGSEEFDQKALSAVEAASPFPAPSELILRKLVRGDVLLGFPI